MSHTCVKITSKAPFCIGCRYKSPKEDRQESVRCSLGEHSSLHCAFCSFADEAKNAVDLLLGAQRDPAGAITIIIIIIIIKTLSSS